jgi:hypothetical protein
MVKSIELSAAPRRFTSPLVPPCSCIHTWYTSTLVTLHVLWLLHSRNTYHWYNILATFIFSSPVRVLQNIAIVGVLNNYLTSTSRTRASRKGNLAIGRVISIDF